MVLRDDESELDLTDEDVPGTARPPEPRLAAYDPSRTREHTRAALAIIVMVALVLVVLGALIGAVAGTTAQWDQIAKALGLLLSPLVALAGTISGFYYSAKPGGQE